nr:MAG TPA: hypothetical protein [Caudoviricetes sp.]
MQKVLKNKTDTVCRHQKRREVIDLSPILRSITIS